MSGEEEVQTKEGIALLSLPDGYGIRGFKTMFNREFLASAGGVYDKASSTWKFEDGNVACASWEHVVRKSEEANAKKLPAFQTKKKKTSVTLDDDDATTNVADASSDEPPKKKPRAAPRKSSAKKKPSNNDDDAVADAEDAPIAKRKSFKKTKPIDKNAAAASAAAAAAVATATAASWDLTCDDIGDVKELDVALAPPITKTKPRFSLATQVSHQPTHDTIAVDDGDDMVRTINVANMSHLTRTQCDLLYNVGAECVVTVTFRVGWEPPALNQTSHTSETETISLPCIVDQYEVVNGRLHLSVRPVPERTPIVHLLIPGFWFNVITPDDRFAFMSQPLSALRDRNMKNCVFETTFSSLWQSSKRDACQTIAYTIRL